jgi:hypothetical protein
MKGTVTKRCACPARYNDRGQRIACKLPHGSWYYIASLGTDPQTGKLRQTKRGGFATKADAETALTELITDTDGVHTAAGNQQGVVALIGPSRRRAD